MKIKFSIISAGGLLSGLAICPFTPASAIEPPADTATPPAALLRENHPAPTPVADNTAFLGIATAVVPGMLAEHLDLRNDTGVIVRTVCPDSPAEKAGLAVNDVLTTLDGKEIASPDSFSAMLREHKAGDRVKIELIHKGKSVQSEATLSERPADLVAQGGTEPFFEGIPKIQADRLRGLIEQNLDALGSGGGNASPDAQFEEAFRKIRDRMNHNLGERAMPLSQGAQGDVAFQQKSVIRLMDGNGSVEINSSEGDTQVKVRDRENKVVWSGPWNTEEDKASAPKDIRGRIDKVNSGSGAGFSFHFGTTRDEPDTLGH